jgi:hypothetical protein
VSTEENMAAERRYYEEVWHRRNLAAIEELVAPDVPGQGPGGRASGSPSGSPSR